MFEEEKIAKRWAENIQELFSDPQRSTKLNIATQEGAKIMGNEVRHAIASLKSDKATDGDGMSAEVLKALNDKGNTIVTELLNLNL